MIITRRPLLMGAAAAGLIVAAAAANDGRAGDLRTPVGSALIEAAQAVV